MQRRAITASLIVALAAGAAMAEPPNFDFNGYAQVPGSIGQPLVVRTVLTNNGVVPTPIPLDFAGKQYTLVIDAILAGVNGLVNTYISANIAIYEDPIGGGTAADYANPATFSDGTLILTGFFDQGVRRTAFTGSLGSFLGRVQFNGGSMLAALGGLVDWPCGGGWSRTISGIPAGYHENWDGKIDLGAVGVESRSWDEIKQLYR